MTEFDTETQTEPDEIRLIRGLLYPRDGDVRADVRGRFGFNGDLLELFASNKGAVVHKWHHYLPLYDRYFARWRNRRVRFLEIGVSRGGSLAMWRTWFGPQATITGIDIDPKCARLDGKAGAVRIGDQADPAFLASVVDEMGGIDIVLDDGSHRMDHIRDSFRVLFPRLADGGVYMIEDLHTAYFPSFGGGHGAEANFFNMVRELIDDMHAWYHAEGRRHPEISARITGMHVHDSIVVFDKGAAQPPVHSAVG